MPDVVVEKQGHVLTVTLNRPQRRNAMTLAMFARLSDAWDLADGDDEIRVIVLTGADGHFSAGMDLRAMSGDIDPTDDYDVAGRMEREGSGFIYDGLLKTRHPRVPVVAAVEGTAIAGGTELLQGTDIRIAGESAVFGVSEVRWALYPMGGSAVRLPRQISFTEAADLLLTGRHVSAAEARGMGLIGQVVPDGSALARAYETAATIAENGPLAVRAIKELAVRGQYMPIEYGLRMEQAIGQVLKTTEDAREGPRAFAEKRRPDFTGR